MKIRILACMILLLTAPAQAQVGTRGAVPVHLPERPFVLLDAPRRFLPTESAHVRLQVRDGGEVEAALFRVTEPDAVLGQAGRRDGMAVAATNLGEETEALLGDSEPLPRRGARLTLLRTRRVAMPTAQGLRDHPDEAVVYDSNEDVEENVATYWVRDGSWAVQRVPFGRLRPGLYLVQVRAAAWVASALLSVGELVVVARRGDRGDIVRITGPDGSPRPGVQVSASAGDRTLATARTDRAGIARFEASDAEVVRFRAEAGPDLAWADASHVRLRPCDPRVYVATGRPLYRPGEQVHVRGHVRGCADDGYGPLAGERVELRTADEDDPVVVTSDAGGNFVAQLSATGEVVATLDGRAHRRGVRLDHRSLPTRDLIVEADRPWAAAGEVIRVTVSDSEGGWPTRRDVVLDTPSGRLVGTVAPGHPAVFSVPVPPTDAPLDRMPLHASLSHAGTVVMASAELFIGRSRTLLSVDTESERGATGQPIGVEARLSDLGDRPLDGLVRLAVRGSDGNRAVGPVLAETRARAVDGAIAVQLPLLGRGPWMIEGTSGDATAQRVVWARRRPPGLARRGELAVSPTTRRTRPSESLAVDVRLPPGRGAGWLTLEQGGVLHQAPIRGAGTVTRVRVPVPDAARGLASLVVTHVEGGRVRTASATVEVQTSEPIEVAIQSDQTVYARGETAHVTIEAKTERDARPRDGVVSLWLADAGYWGMGEDAYPAVDDYLRLPGRPASAADSSAPTSFGAEEGRRLDSVLIYDGASLRRASHRHGWRYGGDVVTVRAEGRFGEIASALAAAAGFARGESDCTEEDDPETHFLRVANLPWDLVAERLADVSETQIGVDGDTLRFDCHRATGLGGGGSGVAGFGAGGLGMMGHGRAGVARQSRLEGTLHFVGLARLGPDGRLELDVPLPDHPGRWRVEVLAIADDGAGARGHRVLHTRQAVEAWVEAPPVLRPGDRTEAVVRVRGRGERARIALTVPPGLRLVEGPPPELRLVDGQGEASFTVEAIEPGAHDVEVAVEIGADRDASRTPIEVAPPWTRRDLYWGATVGPDAAQIDVPLPELASATRLQVALDPSPQGEVERLLRILTTARWDFGAMRADRLASLAALRRVAHVASMTALEDRLDHAIEGEVVALRRLQTSTGELGWGDRADPALTLEVLALLPSTERDGWDAARAQLRDRYDRGALDPASTARALRLLDLTGDPEPRLRRALDAAGDDVVALTELVRAAEHFGRYPLRREAAGRLVAAIDARLASADPSSSCRGPGWFLCFARRGDRGTLARAALALSDSGDRRAGEVTARVGAWLARDAAEPFDPIWGTDEADVLELLARRPRARDRVEVRLDGRRVRLDDGEFEIPAGAHRLELRFARRADRLRRVLVTGRGDVAPPSSPQGDVQLDRRFEQTTRGWEARVTFELPRRAERVDLTIPLPAGLTVDQRRAERPGLAVVDGSVRLRLEDVPRGAHTIELPLLAQAAGEFTAGPALVAADGGRQAGMTTASRVATR